MRQGQQNRRGRGRNNNHSNNNNNNNQNSGRKHQNPLTRTFESNGPNERIRGTPAHVAEKYVALARDALSSGDPVLAENYLQHAEHYNRIIMAYREQQASLMEQQQHQQRHRLPIEELGEDAMDEGEDGGRFQHRSFDQQPRWNGNGHGQQPQPGGAAQPPMQHERGDRPDRDRDRDRPERMGRDRPERSDRDRPERGDRERPDRGDRDRPERMERGDRERPDRDRPERERTERDRGERDHQPGNGHVAAHGSGDAEGLGGEAVVGDDGGRRQRTQRPRRSMRGRDRDEGGEQQPDFLTRPIRRPRQEAVAEEGDDRGEPAAVAEDGADHLT